MINPEYKVVNDSIFLPEGGNGLKSKTRIKFIQEKDGVALYDGGAYIGQFISSTGDKTATFSVDDPPKMKRICHKTQIAYCFCKSSYNSICINAVFFSQQRYMSKYHLNLFRLLR